MDSCGSIDSPISGDVGVICESAADPPDPPSGNREQSTLNDLATHMNDSLSFQDSQTLTCDLIPSHEKDDMISFVKEDKSDDCDGMDIGNASANKSVDKCATFPCSSKITAGVGNTENRDGQTTATSEQGCLQDFATQSPSTLKLVPAIKGSREKLGSPPRRLSVTWAPDVYDPVPTAVSHVPTNKSQRHRSDSKKNGRNKQKGGGKSSRGSGKSKDKKQSRKAVGSSSRCYKALVDDFPEAPPEPLASMEDFEVDSPDAFCGSSFLKKSVEQLHFPVAEAT